jgi:hypothetical protein
MFGDMWLWGTQEEFWETVTLQGRLHECMTMAIAYFALVWVSLLSMCLCCDRYASPSFTCTPTECLLSSLAPLWRPPL